ncbi:hypothetical protein B566_EDAN001025 [Ephemera danica]|nr:hypothetical protein B566_EDAN001025 [Ephemera danica]
MQSHMQLAQFGFLDYSVFAAMLGVSALIGIYFGFFARRDNTTSEYLMGGKNMGIFPVSMSLISSYISGITLLGMPSEIYVYGTQYWAVVFAILLMSIGCGVFFLPVFYRLQLNTSYEYLQIRFDRRVRLLGSVLFIISTMLYIPIVVYVPALAFSQVYPGRGGMKAVVWTDALQTVLMFGGMLVVVGVGTLAIGGPDVVWQRSEDSGRIEFFNMNPDPTVRHTFWNIAFGSFFGWVTHISVNQGMVQRFLAMPSIGRARVMLVIFCIGVLIIVSLSCFTGLLIYATSMSTGLNSMSGVLYEDFIKPGLNIKLSEARASIMMKLLCVAMGVFCVLMVFVVENLGGVLQVSGSLGGITTGPMLGIFVLGMFIPWANSLGTLVGGFSGLIVMSWISFGTQAAIANNQITFPRKPVSVDGCLHLFSDDSTETPLLPLEVQEEPLSIYHLSYTLYTLTGLAVVLCVGLAVSFLSGPQDPDKLDPDLLTPPVRYWLKNRQQIKHEHQSQPPQVQPLLPVKLQLGATRITSAA